MNVQDFLLTPEDLNEEKEVKVSEKLPAFKLRALTGTELDRAQRLATVSYKAKGGMPMKSQDQSKFLDKLVEMSVITPELDNSELQEHYGTVGDPAGTARAMLKAGEYQDLINAIQELSGFDEEDEIEEVKN